jgi:hypothetical protein
LPESGAVPAQAFFCLRNGGSDVNREGVEVRGVAVSYDASISALVGGRITVWCLLDECQNERAGRTLGWAGCTSRDFLGYQGYGIINHHK